MKISKLMLTVGCAMALSVPAFASSNVMSRNVVGFNNITVNQGFNLIAFPFQKIPATRGEVTGNDATTITDAEAAWAADFDYVENGVSTFYVEITSGPFEGRHMTIDSHTADTLTITGGVPADIDPGDLVGATYKIVAANRIRDLFGEPGSPKLQGSAGAGAADNVLIWSGSAWRTAVYYQTEDAFGFPVDAWKQGVNTVDDMVVDRDEAVFVRRRNAPAATLTVVGEVSPNAQRVVFQQGFNLVGGVSVIEEIIGDTTLTDTLVGSAGAGAADNILEWSGSAWRTAVYYQTEDAFGFPVNEWKRGAETVTETFPLNPTQGYFVRVRNEPVNPIWVRQSPLPTE